MPKTKLVRISLAMILEYMRHPGPGVVVTANAIPLTARLHGPHFLGDLDVLQMRISDESFEDVADDEIPPFLVPQYARTLPVMQSISDCDLLAETERRGLK